MSESSVLAGQWSYRSFINDPNLTTPVDQLLIITATITINDAPFGQLGGQIAGTGFTLTLQGSINYGDPFTVRFVGTGIVNGEQWSYGYVGYMINRWPNGINQVPVIVGSLVRNIPHSGTQPGQILPAGFVGSFIAVQSST